MKLERLEDVRIDEVMRAGDVESFATYAERSRRHTLSYVLSYPTSIQGIAFLVVLSQEPTAGL